MKLFQVALTLGLIAASAVLVLSEEIEEYDYEDGGAAAPPPPPPPPQRGRGSLLAQRQNKASPVLSGANKINKQSGAKAAPAAKAPPAPVVQQEPEEEFDEYDQAQEEPVEQTSTEAPKKTVGPIVRPFRSNDDLLAALKRRRQQVQNSGAVVEKSSTSAPATSAPAPSKKSSNSYGSQGRQRNGGNRIGPSTQQQEDFSQEADSPKKTTQSRKYNHRTGSRAAPATVLEDIPDEEQPKPKFGRGSRRPA